MVEEERGERRRRREGGDDVLTFLSLSRGYHVVTGS